MRTVLRILTLILSGWQWEVATAPCECKHYTSAARGIIRCRRCMRPKHAHTRAHTRAHGYPCPYPCPCPMSFDSVPPHANIGHDTYSNQNRMHCAVHSYTFLCLPHTIIIISMRICHSPCSVYFDFAPSFLPCHVQTTPVERSNDRLIRPMGQDL